MNWRRGLRRLRMVGVVAFGLGLVTVLSLYLTSAQGYVPDAAFVPLLRPVGPLGIALVILGGVSLIVWWVLEGFVPEAASGSAEAAPRRAHLDQ